MRRAILTVIVSMFPVATMMLLSLPSYGQQSLYPITGREPACGCYCGYPNYESFGLKICTSRLQEDACEDGMKKLPAEEFKSLCRKMQAKLKHQSDQSPCKKLFSKICGDVCEDISCYCGYGPDKGFVYYSGSPGGEARSEPFANAPVVATLNRGGRYVYRGTTRTVSGETWFLIEPPGLAPDPELGPRTAWVPGRALSCRRPTAPPPPRPTKIVDTGIGVAKTTSTQAGPRG